MTLVLAHVQYIDFDAEDVWIVGVGDQEFTLNTENVKSLRRALEAHHRL